MLTAIIFILILSVLVLIHEFGHFISAKKLGVRVEEFGLGLPPRVWGKKFGETIYSINLLPFGGFVKLTGEDEGELDAIAEKDSKPDPKSFATKTPLQRIIILVAGVFMNLLLAVFLYYLFFFFNGFKTLNFPLLFDYKFKYGVTDTVNTVVIGFSKDSPLQKAGVLGGDAILKINGNPVNSIEDVRKQVSGNAGKTVTVTLADLRKPSEPQRTVDVTPVNENGVGILGVYLGKSVSLEYKTLPQKLFSGFAQAYNMLAYSKTVLGSLIDVSVKSKSIAPVSEGVSGPVGIYSVIGNILAYEGKQAYLGIIDFVALMSLSLAFLNILPFPALDGGRVFFTLIELVTRRKVNPSVEMAIHKWGMAILLALIILVTIKDIRGIF